MKRTSLLLPSILLVLFVAACTPGASGPRERVVLDLAVADPGAASPTTAVDARTGTVFVAYTSRTGGTTNVYLARLEAGRDTLSVPVRVNDRAGAVAAHRQAPAQVAVGPEGNVYVAWVTQTPVPGRRFPASDLRLARSTDSMAAVQKLDMLHVARP
jgi:hypothetical protein